MQKLGSSLFLCMHKRNQEFGYKFLKDYRSDMLCVFFDPGACLRLLYTSVSPNGDLLCLHVNSASQASSPDQEVCSFNEVKLTTSRKMQWKMWNITFFFSPLKIIPRLGKTSRILSSLPWPKSAPQLVMLLRNVWENSTVVKSWHQMFET